MDAVKEKKSSVPFLRQCFVTLGVALNVISHGTVLGFSATLIPSLRLPDSHIRPTVTEESSIASIIGIALIAGNIIMTPLMSSLGRKPCHIICLLPILIGWFIIVNANSVMEIVFARFLQGITLGMMAPLSPVIIAEMTHPANRGAFLSTISLSVSTGVFISHSVGSYLSWQRTALLMSFIPFLSLIIVICSPESPSWFISKGRIEEASRTFHWLRGDNEKENAELDSMINAQNMVRKSSIAGQKVSVSIKFRRGLKYLSETFRKPEFFKPILTVFFLFLAFQFSGVNVMNAYAIDIIRQVVGPDANAEVFMVALDINRLIVNIISVFLMRILKRRTILSIAGIMCVLCYYLKALYVYLRLNNSLPSALQGQWIPVVILFVYISFSIGLSIVPFAISGEIFPLEYRSLAGCISSIPWSINFFIAVKCFPILTISMGLPLTYILYGSIVLVCLIVLYYSLPETKDRTLQEIEDTFRGRTAMSNLKVSEPLNPTGNVDIMRRNSSVILYGM